MQQLQNEIADTIIIPYHLKHLDTDCQDQIWILLNVIYTQCICDEFLSEREVLIAQLEVDEQSYDIKELCSPEDFFLIWQWIGKTCSKWLKSAVEHQEFESATNLKKVLNLNE